MNDEEFVKSLEEYLNRYKTPEEPDLAAPVMEDENGIDRTATLALPCYADYESKEK